MSKKVFIVSSTPRNNGNSDILADEFARGATEAGHSVEKVNIREIDLKYCIGCLACQKTGKCVLNDAMNALYERVQNSDVLVFATPIYYYGMSGQLKTFLDRLNPLYPKTNRFKSVYLIAAAADTEESAVHGAAVGVQGWIDCFDGVTLDGTISGLGVDKAGEIRGKAAIAAAYSAGKNI